MQPTVVNLEVALVHVVNSGVDVSQEPHVVLSQHAVVNWEVALFHVVNFGVDLGQRQVFLLKYNYFFTIFIYLKHY